MENLQELYEKSHATLSAIANKTGFCVSTIQRYVNGKVKFPIPKYEDRIREVLENIASEKGCKEVKTDVKLEDAKDNTKEDTKEDANTKIETNEINCDNHEIDVNELKEQMNRNSVMSSGNYHSYNNNSTTTNNGNGLYTITSRLPKRSEVWYVKPSSSTTGREIWSGSQNRPCVVIQSNKLSGNGTYIIAYLTKQVRECENPALVTVMTNITSTVICSQLYTVSKDRFVNCTGSVTDLEMSLIERAILTVLDIKVNPKSEIQHVPDYIAIKTELAVYKRFYEDYIRIKSIK